jgi:hypothetical protein
VSIFALILISSSCIRSGSVNNAEREKIDKFFEMRESGNTVEAWKMLSDKSRKIFLEKDFKEYCFIYKVSEIIDVNERDGYYKVKYNFYDKKYKKNSNELYTFYIRDNVENLKVDKTGIVFPYTGYLFLRKAVEKRDMNDIDATVKKMLQIDRSNPDVIKSAEKMGIDIGQGT